MHSAIYEGKVRHRRFSPIRNTFQYRLFLMYVDLAELPTLSETDGSGQAGRSISPTSGEGTTSVIPWFLWTAPPGIWWKKKRASAQPVPSVC